VEREATIVPGAKRSGRGGGQVKKAMTDNTTPTPILYYTLLILIVAALLFGLLAADSGRIVLIAISLLFVALVLVGRRQSSQQTRALQETAARLEKLNRDLSYYKDRYHALVNSLPGPTFLGDATGAMTFVSPQIESLLGYSPKEWLSDGGRFWLHLIHPDERKRIPTTLDMREYPQGVRRAKARMLCKDGNYRWIENHCTLCSSEGEPFIVGLLLDIDARHQAQTQIQSHADELKIAYQELQEAQQQLIRSAQLAMVGELATGVSHELNNPLAAIRGLAQVLIAKQTENDHSYEPLNQIIANTGRMNKIIKHLRGFARQTSLERTSVNLNQTLEGALTLLHVQLVRHQIELIKEFDPDLPLVRGVPRQLEQVAANLLTNARDAILEKQAPGQITLRTRYDPADRHVYLSVTDTGVGIPPESHSDIFTPFFTTKGDSYGAGLGLSTSYRIIQEHKGHILFDSQSGRGTTFTVLLPAEQSRSL